MYPNQLVAATHKNTWLKVLLREGALPELAVLEEVIRDDWQEEEKWWIEYLKFIGCALTNGTAGGDGGGFPGKTNHMYGRTGPAHPCYGIPRSEETKAKIRATQKGQPRRNMPEGWKDRVGALGKTQIGTKNPFYGRKHSGETRESWSKKRKGVVPPNARKLTIDGKPKYTKEWSAVSGVKVATINARLLAGRSAKDAVFGPIRKSTRVYELVKKGG
jgi:hypothetical protein